MSMAGTIPREALNRLLEAIEKLADAVVAFGEVEKSLGRRVDVVSKELMGVLAEHKDKIASDPSLAAQVALTLLNLTSAAYYFTRRFEELTPNEKIEAGRALKDLVNTVRKVVG